MAGVAGGWASGSGGVSAAAATALPSPGASGIDHIVVVMMENRSFDHFFGWLPGADGRQAGLHFTRPARRSRHATHHLTEFASCGFADPDHSYEGGRIELNGGKLRRLAARPARTTSFSHRLLTRSPTCRSWAARRRTWTVCDQYFAAVMAETYPNRFYQHAAQTDRLHNYDHDFDSCRRSGIGSRRPGVSGRYYFSDVPFIALWGLKYLPITKPFDDVPLRCRRRATARGVLRRSALRGRGLRHLGDDHPRADIRAGEQFLNQVYTPSRPARTGRARCWSSTSTSGAASSTTSPPGKAPDVTPPTALRGFRVPALVISPRARRGYVDAQHLRPHLDPQGDRVAVEPATADPAGHGGRTTSPRSWTSPRRRQLSRADLHRAAVRPDGLPAVTRLRHGCGRVAGPAKFAIAHGWALQP